MDLYYKCGRSPTVDQLIQEISARLLQYDKIEWHNVFYWFKNRKGRERQKKQLTDVPTTTTTKAASITSPGGGDGMVTENSMPWMGFETPVMAGQFQQEPGGMVAGREIETLPLFPVHTQEQEQQEEEATHDGFGYGWKGYDNYFPGFYWGGDQVEMEGVMTGYNHQPCSSSAAATAAASSSSSSLELSLGSCYYGPPGSTRH